MENQPSPVNTTPTTPLTNQLPNALSNPITVREEPKESKPIALMVVLVILIGLIAGGLYWLRTTTIQKVKTHVDTQVDQLSELKETYGEIVHLIQTTSESTEDETQLLGAFTVKLPEQAVPTNGLWPGQDEASDNILGLEEDPSMQQMRAYGELVRTARNTAEAVDTTNQSIQKNTSGLNSLIVPSNTSLYENTEIFALDTLKLMNYLVESNSIEIEATTIGYEFGIVLAEAIYRAGDEESVDKLEAMLKKLETVRDKAIALNTDGLPENMVRDHQATLENYESETKVLYDLVENIKRKDLDSLEKNLASLMIDAERLNSSGQVEAVSFWQNNETVRDVESILEQWVTYQSSL